MSSKKEMQETLISMGFELNYITRAFKVYEKQYGNKYNIDVMIEIIVRLQNKDKLKQYPFTEQELRDDFVMLTEDGGIKKKIISESKEPELGSPPNGSKVICHYIGTFPHDNNKKFDSSRDRNYPFSFKIGEGQVIKGWDIGVASMKKGERCIFRLASPYAYGDSGSPPKIPGGATLDFDVELIEWDEWDECSGSDGKISKKIIVASSGGYDDKVSEDDKVTITYRIYYIDNGIDEIMVERKKFDMIVDDDDRITEAFHIALKSMKKEEKSLFKIKDTSLMNMDDIYIDPEEFKTNKFNNNKMKAPDDKHTFYEIMVHEMVKAKEKWNVKNEERIEMGSMYKNDGNELFKANRYSGAIKKYKKALDWIDIDFSDDSLAKQKIELVVSANNNLALIYIKMKDWSKATEHASIVLEKDGNNLKALIRRGQATLQNGFFEESKKDLKKAQSLDKNNMYIKKLLKICTVKYNEYIQKQEKLYSGLFEMKKKKKGAKEKKKENENNDKKDKEKINVDDCGKHDNDSNNYNKNNDIEQQIKVDTEENEENKILQFMQCTNCDKQTAIKYLELVEDLNDAITLYMEQQINVENGNNVNEEKNDEQEEKQENDNDGINLSHKQLLFKEYFLEIQNFGDENEIYYQSIHDLGYDDFEMMLCFDDDILLNEIGIKKKLHRKYFIKKIKEFEENHQEFKNWLYSIKMSDYYQIIIKNGIMTFQIFYKLFANNYNGLIHIVGVNNEKDAKYIWNNAPKHLRQNVENNDNNDNNDIQQEGQPQTQYI